MSDTVLAAIISGLATVLAAFIGIIGLSVMLKLKAKMKLLADEVQKYHAHEGKLVEKVLELQGISPDSAKVKHHRGILRTELSEHARPSMTALAARKIANRLL